MRCQKRAKPNKLCSFNFFIRMILLPKKHTYEEVYQIYRDHGCELLELEYINSKTSMKYRCSCGNISYNNLNSMQRGHKCNICGQQLSVAKRFLTIDKIREALLDHGVELLTDEYYGNKQKLEFICFCGKIDKKCWNNLLYHGMWCRDCGKEKRSGTNHYNYNPELTSEDRLHGRHEPENYQWRISIYKRDHSTCQLCESKINVQAHHLYAYSSYRELRYDIDNGICLCKKCHDLFHNLYGRGKNTKEQFIEFCNNEIYKIVCF